MSRASDLRDEIADWLQGQQPNYQVDKVYYPNYQLTELKSKPRIFVAIGGRTMTIGQAIDPTDVHIDIGLAGIANTHDKDASGTPPRDAMRDKIDEFDGLYETLFRYWQNSNDMHGEDFRFVGIEQGRFAPGSHFDVQKLIEDGVYITFFRLTYRDQDDRLR